MKRRVAAAAGGAAVALLVSWYGFFFYRDNFSTHYPVKVISAQSFRSSEIPYWNFYDGGGQPLAGNPNALTFYPDNILYLFLPARVAFNLHFLIHIAAAFFAMRALTRSTFGGAAYALSGAVISATAFYNLIVAAAMIPLAFFAVHRRRPFLLGIACGLLGLAGEPLTIVATAVAVAILAWRQLRAREVLIAGALAAVIVSPQLIAYSEIAGEVERSVRMSAQTVLKTSLAPIRIAEIAFGPLVGFLNDAGHLEYRARLFSTIFFGIIALPALVRRSRYVLIVAVMLFFALGRYNPIVAFIVERVPLIRIVRFPEKFALPAIAALTVLSVEFVETQRRKRLWVWITILPLVWCTWRALPIDVFSAYELGTVQPGRVHIETRIGAGVLPARIEYRTRAKALEPMFGAVEGLRYAITPSPDGMHALRSRMVLERFAVAGAEMRAKYLRLAGCDVAKALPRAYFPDRVFRGRNIYEEAAVVENRNFNDQTDAVTTIDAFTPAPARVVSFAENGQSIEVSVDSAGKALLVINETFFSAWRASTDDGELPTVPVNIDRLGIIVPAGESNIVLRFGRHHTAIAMAWIASAIALCLAPLVEKRYRRAGEIQRAGDDDGAEARA